MISPLVVLIWAATGAIVGELIGARKGRPWTGVVLGVLLGWIGVIIIAVTPPTREKLVQRERERLEIQREARGGWPYVGGDWPHTG